MRYMVCHPCTQFVDTKPTLSCRNIPITNYTFMLLVYAILKCIARLNTRDLSRENSLIDGDGVASLLKHHKGTLVCDKDGYCRYRHWIVKNNHHCHNKTD